LARRRPAGLMASIGSRTCTCVRTGWVGEVWWSPPVRACARPAAGRAAGPCMWPGAWQGRRSIDDLSTAQASPWAGRGLYETRIARHCWRSTDGESQCNACCTAQHVGMRLLAAHIASKTSRRRPNGPDQEEDMDRIFSAAGRCMLMLRRSHMTHSLNSA